MTLKDWLDKQGFPHGMECVGEARLQQLWDAAQREEREECAKVCEERGRSTKTGEWHGNNHAAASFAESIRKRSNAEVTRPGGFSPGPVSEANEG